MAKVPKWANPDIHMAAYCGKLLRKLAKHKPSGCPLEWKGGHKKWISNLDSHGVALVLYSKKVHDYALSEDETKKMLANARKAFLFIAEWLPHIWH